MLIPIQIRQIVKTIKGLIVNVSNGDKIIYPIIGGKYIKIKLMGLLSTKPIAQRRLRILIAIE